MVAARRRRRRRPILPLLALVVTAGVIVATLTRGSAHGPDQRLAWLDEVRPAVEQSNELGLELVDLRNQVTKLDRPTLSRRLSRLSAEGQALLAQVDHSDAPSSLSTTQALLVACFAVRSQAVDDLARAFDVALGSGPVPDAVASLAGVGQDLATADRTYEVFLARLPRYRQPAAIASKWVADPGLWDDADLTAFVTHLRSSASLVPIHDVAVVTLATDPPPVGKEGAADVLPVVSSLRLHTVVANVGNESQRHVTVIASLNGPAGVIDTARQFVDLAPGQRMAVQLGGLRPPPNQPLTLSVRIEPVPGETNVSDNQLDRPLVVRQPGQSPQGTPAPQPAQPAQPAPPTQPASSGGNPPGP